MLALALGGCANVLGDSYRYGVVDFAVSDLEGAPVEGVPTTLYTGRALVESARTGATGHVVFRNVPFGEYGVAISVPNGYLLPFGGKAYVAPITVTEGTTAKVSLTLSANCCATIRVSVRSAAGAPSAGSPVTLTDPVGGHLDATAGTDGAAVFRGVSTGIYTATAAPPPPAPASPATRAVASGIRVQQTSDTTVVLILP